MKKLGLAFSEAAAADVVEQSDWYEQQSDVRLAKRWQKSVTTAVLQILDRPRAGAISRFPHAELRDIRRVPIPGFPKHLIFYPLGPTEILILRIVHGARDLEGLL